MIDIARLRENPEAVKENMRKKFQHDRLYLVDEAVVAKLFDEIAPKYEDRNGGYTRILKLGPRQGDNAEVVFVELV